MSMFKHLLLPIDGSKASEAAIRQGLRLAQEHEARVTALHVTPQFHWVSYRSAMLEDTREEFLAAGRASGQKLLAEVERAAQELGVPCEPRLAANDHPFEAIVAAAREAGCDLIVMASHGHRGLKGLLLGSETQKVLTHSSIPVLVLRSDPAAETSAPPSR